MRTSWAQLRGFVGTCNSSSGKSRKVKARPGCRDTKTSTLSFGDDDDTDDDILERVLIFVKDTPISIVQTRRPQATMLLSVQAWIGCCLCEPRSGCKEQRHRTFMPFIHRATVSCAQISTPPFPVSRESPQGIQLSNAASHFSSRRRLCLRFQWRVRRRMFFFVLSLRPVTKC